MRRRAGGAVLALVALVVVIVIVVAVSASRRHGGVAYDPASTRPSGARALVELLDRFDVPVSVQRGLDDLGEDGAGATLLVLEPFVDDDTYREIMRRARLGTTVVLAASDSPEQPPLGVGVKHVESVSRGRCDTDLLPGVTELVGLAVRYRVDAVVPDADPDVEVCFASPLGAAVVVQRVGAGRVVHVGGPEVFVNRNLAAADNAVLATDLLVADTPSSGLRTPVVVVRRAVLDGDRTLLELLPGGFWRIMAQLGLALGLLVWAAAPRHGRPVREPVLWPLPGTAPTEAIGQLYQRSGRSALAASWIRRRLRRQLLRTYQLPPDAPATELATAAARSRGRPEDAAALADALEREPVDHATQLVALARNADRLRREERDE